METIEQIFKENAHFGSKNNNSLIADYISLHTNLTIDELINALSLYKKYDIEPIKQVNLFMNTTVIYHGTIVYITDGQFFNDFIEDGCNFNYKTATLEHIKKYIKITEDIKGGIYDQFIIYYCLDHKEHIIDVIIELYNSKHIVNASTLYYLYAELHKKPFNYEERKKIYMANKDKFNLRGIFKMFDIYKKFPLDLKELNMIDIK